MHYDENTLDEYARRELSDEHASEVATHLTTCERCHTQVADARALRAWLQQAAQWSERPFPGDLATQIRSAIERDKHVSATQRSAKCSLNVIGDVERQALLKIALSVAPLRNARALGLFLSEKGLDPSFKICR